MVSFHQLTELEQKKVIIDSKIDSALESGENASKDGVAREANLEADKLEKDLTKAKAEIEQTKEQLNANK